MAYGKYRHSTIKGQAGTTWHVEVWQKDYIAPSVGDEIEGGVVLHVSATDVYVIAKESIGEFEWGCNGTDISGANGTAIGTGYQNTLDIVSSCSAIDSSAYMCSDLTLNGYSDWYLPSKDEIHKFYQNKSTLEAVSGFEAFSGAYWSSTEVNYNNSRYAYPSIGGSGVISKTQVLKTRPIRSYSISFGSTEMNLSGEGFEVKWTGEGGTRDRQFIASECVLNMFVENQDDEDWLYNDVFQKGDNYHYIRIYKNSVSDDTLWWYGWIQPGFDVIENSPFPYEFKLTATDSYGYFGKKKPSKFTNQADKVQAYRIKDLLISDFGVDMNLISMAAGDLAPNPHNRESFRTSVDWWRPENTYQANDPFKIYYAARGAFVEKQGEDEEDISEGNPLEYKSIDVINGVLKTFNTVGFLAEGFYNFIQPNSLADNTTGEIRVYDYASTITSPDPDNLNTLLTIDQSTNVVLGGSTITYEPSFEGVRLTYKQGLNSIDLFPGNDLTSPTVIGMIQSLDEGIITLNFNAKHIERIDRTSFPSLNPTSAPYWHILDNSFLTTATLTISITDGSTTKYLQDVDGGLLTWSSSAQTITIYRGYTAAGLSSTGVNSTTAIGNISNIEYLNINSSSTSYPHSIGVGGPCYSTYYNTEDKYKFTTDIKFSADVEHPGITGDISIELDASNSYDKAHSGVALYMGTLITTVFESQAAPTPIESSSTESAGITFTPTGSEDWAEQGESMVYQSTQTENTSYESFDLGDYNLGETSVSAEYSVQYYNSGTGILTPASTGFQRGNPTPDEPRNILQLVTKEFLELQVEPLEILQASIFSSNISPLKLVKYSINGDSNYKYYQFLGGSFKAQSETMDGEWYSLNSKKDFISEPDPLPDVPNELAPPPTPNGSIKGQISSTALIAKVDLINKSVGITDSDIDLGITYNKVEFDANSKAKVYDNQKIILSYVDGSNQLILTVSGNNSTSSDQINVDNFTPTTSYPSGCVVSILPYDLSNVITGGGGGTPAGSTRQVQFNDSGSFGAEATFQYDKTTNFLTADNIEGQLFGDNLGNIYSTAIYLTPLDFTQLSADRNYIYTSTNGGSSKLSSSGVNAYAKFQIPKGYQATHIDFYSSSNDTFKVYSCSYTGNSASLLETGTTNTQVIFSPTKPSGLEGKYNVVEFDPNSTSDEIYGVKITIEKI